MRRKSFPMRHNHDRWLISYADFVTLLFALFVVMFAAAENHIKIPQDLAELARTASPNRANLVQPLIPKSQAVVPGPVPLNQDLAPLLNRLTERLHNELQSGQMSMRLEGRGLVITLSQGAFFPSGEDWVDPHSYPSIQKVADAIRELPNAIRLEGHTDSQPVINARFRDNWDLSAARALAMLRALNGKDRIDPKRLAVAGYADTLPLTTDETERGRARNRRVDIVILNSPETEAARQF